MYLDTGDNERNDYTLSFDSSSSNFNFHIVNWDNPTSFAESKSDVIFNFSATKNIVILENKAKACSSTSSSYTRTINDF